MKALGLLLLVAVAVVPSAAAKFQTRLTLSDARPTVAERVLVTLETEPAQPGDSDLRLVAVSPTASLYRVLGRATRTDSPAIARTDGFFVRLVPEGLAHDASVWRATVRFPRRGRWLLVLPNWGAPGYAIPPPIVRPVFVRQR